MGAIFRILQEKIFITATYKFPIGSYDLMTFKIYELDNLDY